jgi:hypothetical protein
MVTICPNCGGKKVRKSHRSFHERVLTIFTLIRPYRCQVCECHFFRPLWFRKSSMGAARQ